VLYQISRTASVLNGLKNEPSYEFIGEVILKATLSKGGFPVLARSSSHEAPRTKLLAARCECLHLIKINCLALWLDESAHACTRSECV
jgi:hypothetical protein